MIGYFGDLPFEVNNDWIQTPKDFQRQASAKWQTIRPIGQRPKSQYVGADEGKITFTMHLDRRFNSDIRQILDLFITWVNQGYTATLILGTKPLGADKWKIVNVTEAFNIILHEGVVMEADVSVSLEEYFSVGFRDDGYDGY